jgi:hypothetical protein
MMAAAWSVSSSGGGQTARWPPASGAGRMVDRLRTRLRCRSMDDVAWATPSGNLPKASERLTLRSRSIRSQYLWSEAGIVGSDTGLLTTIADAGRIVQLRFAPRLFRNVITPYLGFTSEATANRLGASKSHTEVSPSEIRSVHVRSSGGTSFPCPGARLQWGSRAF